MENETFKGRQIFQYKFLLPTEKGSTLKGKNLLLSFQSTPFLKGLGGQDSKQEVTKVVSLVKNSRNSTFGIHAVTF